MNRNTEFCIYEFLTMHLKNIGTLDNNLVYFQQ